MKLCCSCRGCFSPHKLSFHTSLHCCDSDTIKGVGPKTALKLIREHRTIETILKSIDRKKFVVPPSWIPNDNDNDDAAAASESEDEEHPPEKEAPTTAIPAYVQARQLFVNHETDLKVELRWKPCQAEELTKFLVDDMGFNPDRVASSIEKLKVAYNANKKPQMRMDNFFQVKENPNKNHKRKPPPPPAKGAAAKKGRGKK